LNYNAAYSHKTTEDALDGLVKCDGDGNYSAVNDDSTAWGNMASLVSLNSGDWRDAYGWGDHASAGYLTSVTAHDILSATHGDTTPAAVVRGDIIIGSGATPKWTRLAIGAAGTYLAGSATEPSWATLNQAAISGLTTSDSPTFVGLTLSAALSMGGNDITGCTNLLASGDNVSALTNDAGYITSEGEFTTWYNSGTPTLTSLVMAEDGYVGITGKERIVFDGSGNKVDIYGDSAIAASFSDGGATIGALTLTSMAGNWTNAGRTVADMGILTTVDINGGSIDGATIGAASAAAGTFTTLTASGKISTISTTEQLRLGYDVSNYFSTTVGATGAVTFNAVGAGAAFNF
jgi:hypothetical protein